MFGGRDTASGGGDLLFENVHAARLRLEHAAEYARDHYGGSKAAAKLACAAHDLRWFDPKPWVFPVGHTIGR